MRDERGDSAPLLRSAETPPRSPASSSGAISTGQSWSCGSGARGGPSNDVRAGTPLLGGKAGRAGAAQPGEEKAAGRPYCGLSALNGAHKKAGTDFLALGQGVRILSYTRVDLDWI